MEKNSEKLKEVIDTYYNINLNWVYRSLKGEGDDLFYNLPFKMPSINPDDKLLKEIAIMCLKKIRLLTNAILGKSDEYTFIYAFDKSHLGKLYTKEGEIRKYVIPKEFFLEDYVISITLRNNKKFFMEPIYRFNGAFKLNDSGKLEFDEEIIFDEDYDYQPPNDTPNTTPDFNDQGRNTNKGSDKPKPSSNFDIYKVILYIFCFIIIGGLVIKRYYSTKDQVIQINIRTNKIYGFRRSFEPEISCLLF